MTVHLLEMAIKHPSGDPELPCVALVSKVVFFKL